MKNLTYRVLPIFAVALTLCGCGTFDHRPESVSPGGVARIASADANVEPSHEVQSADKVASANASVESSRAVRSAESVLASSTKVESAHKTQPADNRLGINLHVFGLSYHPDRQGTRINHLDNELNIGLGLGYKLHNDARGQTNVEAGFFKDSGRNWAKFAGMGYQFKFGERWKLGADLLAVNSPTYNKGRSFIAPIPRLTYDFGTVKLNAIYIPRFRPINDFAVYAIFFTIPLMK